MVPTGQAQLQQARIRASHVVFRKAVIEYQKAGDFRSGEYLLALAAREYLHSVVRGLAKGHFENVSLACRCLDDLQADTPETILEWTQRFKSLTPLHGAYGVEEVEPSEWR
jgi:hypothetical protein